MKNNNKKKTRMTQVLIVFHFNQIYGFSSIIIIPFQPQIIWIWKRMPDPSQ